MDCPSGLRHHHPKYLATAIRNALHLDRLHLSFRAQVRDEPGWVENASGSGAAGLKEPPDYCVPTVKASVSKVFCSTSCAFADPVAGLALAERLTESTGRLPAIFFNRGST